MEKLTSEQLLEIRDNPNVQKFMDIIGTLESGNRYNVITGGETFDDDSKHPDKFGVRTADGVSDAAGRYQFLNTTFQGIVDQNPQAEITDFSPEAQDKAFILLLKGEGVLDDVMQGGQGHTRAIENLGKQFTSLPSSTKFYKQGGAKTYAYLNEKFGVPFPRPPATPGVSKPSKEEILNTDMTIVQQPFMDPAQQPSSYDIAAALTYLSDTQTNAETNFLNAMMGMPTTGATKSSFDPLTKFLKESAQGNTALDIMVEEQEPRNRSGGSPPEGEVKRTPGAFIGPSEEVSPAMATVRDFFKGVGSFISPTSKGGYYDYFGDYVPPAPAEKRGLSAEELLGIKGVDGEKGIIELFDDAAYGIPITSKRGEDKPFGAPYAIRPKYRQAVADAAFLGLDALSLGYNPLKGAGIVAREGAEQLGDLGKYGLSKLEKDLSGEERLFREGSFYDTAMSTLRPTFMREPFESTRQSFPVHSDLMQYGESFQKIINREKALKEENLNKLNQLEEQKAIVKAEPVTTKEAADLKKTKVAEIKAKQKSLRESNRDPEKIPYIMDSINRSVQTVGNYNADDVGVDPYYVALLGRPQPGLASLNTEELQKVRELENTVKEDIKKGLLEFNDKKSYYLTGFNKPQRDNYRSADYSFFDNYPEDASFHSLPKLFRTIDAEARLGEDNRTLNDKVAKIRLRADTPYEAVISHNDFFFNKDLDGTKLRIFIAPDTLQNTRLFVVRPDEIKESIRQNPDIAGIPEKDFDLGTYLDYLSKSSRNTEIVRKVTLPMKSFFYQTDDGAGESDILKKLFDLEEIPAMEDVSKSDRLQEDLPKLKEAFKADQERMLSKIFLAQVAADKQASSPLSIKVDFQQDILAPMDFDATNPDQVSSLIKAYGDKNLPKGARDLYEKETAFLHDKMKTDFSFLKGNFENIALENRPESAFVATQQFERETPTRMFPNPSIPLSQEEETKVVLNAIEVGLKRATMKQARNNLSPLGLNQMFSVTGSQRDTMPLNDVVSEYYLSFGITNTTLENNPVTFKYGSGNKLVPSEKGDGIELNPTNFKELVKTHGYEGMKDVLLDRLGFLDAFTEPYVGMRGLTMEEGAPRDMGTGFKIVSSIKEKLPMTMNDVTSDPKNLPGYRYGAMDQFTARTVDESSFLESVLDDLEDIPAKKLKQLDFYSMMSLAQDQAKSAKSTTNKVQKLTKGLNNASDTKVRQQLLFDKIPMKGRMADTRLYTKVDSSRLNLSEDTESGWYEDTTKQGFKLRGEMLNNCIKDPSQPYQKACLDVDPQQMRIFHYYNDNGFPVLTYAVKIRDSDGTPFEGNKIKFDQAYGVHNKRTRELLDLNTQIGFPEKKPIAPPPGANYSFPNTLTYQEVKEYIFDPLEDKLREDYPAGFYRTEYAGTGGY